MSTNRSTNRPYRVTAARIGRTLSRRLVIEAMESRLLLSGNQIDDTVWNLDSLTPDYMQISDGPSTTDSTTPLSEHTIPRRSDGLHLGSIADDTNYAPPLPGAIYVDFNANQPALDTTIELDYIHPPLSAGAFQPRPSQPGSLSDLLSSSSQVYLYSESTLRGLKAQLSASGISGDLSSFNDVFVNRQGETAGRGIIFFRNGDFDGDQSLPIWIGDGSLFVLGSNSDTSLYSTEAETNSPSASSPSLNSEGGEVPIAQLVKTVGEAHPVVAAHSPTNNTASQTNDSTSNALAGAGISGELARAVAFEMIEGPGAPIAYAASRDGQQHLATQQASDTNTAESHAQTIAAAGSHSTTISAYLQLPLATTAARKAAANSVARPAMLHQGADLIRLAALVHAADQSFAFAAPWVAAADEFNEVAFDQASLDAARGNAFSQWGDDPDADPAEEQETHHGWLAATPFLAVLAAERYVARKQKRAEAAAAAPAIKRS